MPTGDELKFDGKIYTKIRNIPFADNERYLVAKGEFKENEKNPSSIELEDPLTEKSVIYESR